MRDYDALEPVLHPYLGFTSPHNFRSPSVSTDSAGFRRSEFGGRAMATESVEADEQFGVALGGSFTFGVGATHDRHSVVSRLGEEAGMPFLNRAVRAGNSLQELLAALPLLPRASQVVVCTGVNNLALSAWSARTYDDLGPLFYDEAIATLAGRRLDELGAQAGAAGFRETLRSGLSAVRSRPRPSDPPRPQLDPQSIASAAASRHLRDLELVAAATGPDARLIFVVQPFVPDEHAGAIGSVERRADWWQSTIEFVSRQWPSYVEELRSGCEALGVRSRVLWSSEFEGRAYVDRVHMTDHGQRQAARRIVEVMADGPA